MENKFPGKDITQEDIETKFPLVASRRAKPIEISGVIFDGYSVPVMAGPNMVESEELIVDIAINVKNSGAKFLRGGAFKPLTFPYRSEKYRESGLQGLKWLATAKQEAGIPVITEVMEERYLDEVCEVADILQIGARNMQNYPFIQAAARTGKPLMIKRHFGGSLRDWFGAVEYALLEGNDKIIMCERGVCAPHTHRATSRFMLDLQVIPAAKEITSLPVGTDPSHATFWAPWVEPMALASAACGADFLMIEVHPDPSNAAVDPLQPLDYRSFARLMRRLVALKSSLRDGT
jgi:3-deoxy-7-phosphoheptulonate synthase